MDGVQGVLHVLYARDGDVVYVLVDRTMSELDVASPGKSISIQEFVNEKVLFGNDCWGVAGSRAKS